MLSSRGRRGRRSRFGPAGSLTGILLGALAVAASPGALGAQRSPDAAALAGLDLFMPGPPEVRARPEVVDLGRELFFDSRLSRDSSLACASCHRPDRAFTDGRTVSVGVFGRRGSRNVPTLVNRGWGESFFWDGRIGTLEVQVLQPILAGREMDMTVEGVLRRLETSPRYRTRFRRAFGEDPARETLARALAAYVRSIRAGGSRFDRFTEGDRDALTEREREGLALFQGRAGCVRCHTGPLLTDESFHNTGVAWRDGEPADSGRALVTGRPEDLGAFKTPTLREIPRTAPYMHDGSLPTLGEVVEFYDGGGHPNPHLDPEIRPLHLTEGEKDALVAFLRTLSGRVVEGAGAGYRP